MHTSFFTVGTGQTGNHSHLNVDKRTTARRSEVFFIFFHFGADNDGEIGFGHVV